MCDNNMMIRKKKIEIIIMNSYVGFEKRNINIRERVYWN